MSINECQNCIAEFSPNRRPPCAVAIPSFEIYKTKLKYPAGKIVVDFGELPKGLYIIQKGLIKLELSSANGATLTIRMASPGTLFGYRGLLINEPYYYRAIALVDTSLCLIPKEPLFKILGSHPKFTMKVIEQLASDLKEGDSRWLDQFSVDVCQRVAKVLLELDQKFPNHYWTKKEISQLAGTTHETVFRSLAKLQKANLIESNTNGITIKNKEDLAAFSQG